MPVPSLLVPLTAALNALLATQPASRARLAGHAGKVLRLALPGMNLDLAVDESGALFPAPAQDEPAVTFTPAPDALPLWLAQGRLDPLFGVRGDGVLAADLSAALAGFDWALALRPWLGDVAASRVDGFLRALGLWRAQAMESAGRNLAEYTVYEQAMLAEPGTVREFITGVDAAREAADRLEARIKRLETRRPR